MHTTVPFIGRKVNEDCVIEGKFYPANADVSLAFYLTMRDPEYFPEPDQFKPERFEVVSSNDKQNPYTYTPFAAGPRNCIGRFMHSTFTWSCISISNFSISPVKWFANKLLSYKILNYRECTHQTHHQVG